MCKSIFLPEPHGMWMAPNGWNQLPVACCDELLEAFGGGCWFCGVSAPTHNVYQPHWLPACGECAAKVSAGRLPAPQCCTCLRTCPAAAPRSRAWHSPWRCMPCHVRGFEEAVACAMVEAGDDTVWEHAHAETHARVSARFASVGGEDKWWAADEPLDAVWPPVKKARWRGLPELVLKGDDDKVLVRITGVEGVGEEAEAVGNGKKAKVVRKRNKRNEKRLAVCVACRGEKMDRFVKGMCNACYVRSRKDIRKCVKCNIKKVGTFTKGMCHACYQQSLKKHAYCNDCKEVKFGKFTRGLCDMCYHRQLRK